MTNSNKIIDGKSIAHYMRQTIKTKVQDFKANGQREPGLGVILVGDDPASAIYVKNKRLACDEVGFYSEAKLFPNTVTQETLLEAVHEFNQNEKIDGILVQLPLPDHIDQTQILETILPNKDVDGFHAHNLGRLMQRKPQLRPCTPKGIVMLLSHLNITVKRKHAVVVGASNIVGRPMAMEFLNLGATVSVCHRFTQDLPNHIQQADILVVAAGKPHLIQGEWIKPGAIVLDVGINRLDSGKLVGDVCFTEALDRASYITPVPGGIGPMTIVSLLDNTLQAYVIQNKQADTHTYFN